MTKPSPGPWRLEISEKEANIYAADDYHVANIDLEGIGAIDDEAASANRELELANARLQTAAPGLLAVVKDARAILGGLEVRAPDHNILDKIKELVKYVEE